MRMGRSTVQGTDDERGHSWRPDAGFSGRSRNRASSSPRLATGPGARRPTRAVRRRAPCFQVAAHTAGAGLQAGAAPQRVTRRGRGSLQILRLQSGAFCNPREHTGSDLLGVVKGEDVVRPTGTEEGSVGGAVVTLHNPSDAKERGEDAPRSGTWPDAHAARKETLSGS
jgi:hypothetical protein